MNIQKAIETISLKDLIESTGRMPVSGNATTGEYMYQAPYREDNDPSLKINLVKRKFIDYGQDDAKGDVVQLARLILGNGNLHAVSVSEALQYLRKFAGRDVAPIPAKPTQRTSQPARIVSGEIERFTFLKAAPITARSHKNQLAYITEHRRISLEIASRHLEAISYKDNQAPKTDVLKGNRYAIGGRNDAGGYEARAASVESNFKVSLGPKDITTYSGHPDARTGDIFEGRFDFLTWLQMSGQLKPHNPTILLNTGRLAARAAEVIKTREGWENVTTWRIWQQNDNEGERVTQVICEALGTDYQIGTLNHYWEGFNDLNEFWVNGQPDQCSALAKVFSGAAPTSKFFDTSATSELRRSIEGPKPAP